MIEDIFKILKKETKKYKVPVIEFIKVQKKDPFRILIATILSARTNDRTTAEVCKRLFKKVKSFRDLDKLNVKEIEKLIYPVGFYRNKAKSLKKLPAKIKELKGIPRNIDDLLKLPGVGRKTANLVLVNAFDKDAIGVDVHVHRISNRLGYVKTKNPEETEKALRKKLPRRYWKDINRLFVMLGQNICKPVSPYCSKCPINKYCKKVGVKKRR